MNGNSDLAHVLSGAVDRGLPSILRHRIRSSITGVRKEQCGACLLIVLEPHGTHALSN